MAILTTTWTDAAGDPAVGYVQFTPRALRESYKVEDGIVPPIRVRSTLDGYGTMWADLEPGDYNVAIVLQGSRTVYTVATVPAGEVTLDLRMLLQAYIPTQVEATSEYGNLGTFEWVIPFSATKIDYVLLGGGGRGGWETLIPGAGGRAGNWLKGTLVRGTDIPISTQALSGSVGAGSTEGGVDGGSTILSGVGMTDKIATGGVSGTVTGTFHGQGAGEQTLNGRVFEGGGVRITMGGDGKSPGGGGAGTDQAL